MYYILEKYHDSFYTEAMANDEFSSLQAAEKKLQALKDLKPEGKYFLRCSWTLGYLLVLSFQA